jgi:hypothetical protein
MKERRKAQVKAERVDPDRVRYSMDSTNTKLLAFAGNTDSITTRLVWDFAADQPTAQQLTLFDFYNSKSSQFGTSDERARDAQCESDELYHVTEKRIQDMDGYESDVDYEGELDRCGLRECDAEEKRQARRFLDHEKLLHRRFRTEIYEAGKRDQRLQAEAVEERKAALLAIEEGEKRDQERKRIEQLLVTGGSPPVPPPFAAFDNYLLDCMLTEALTRPGDPLSFHYREELSDEKWAMHLSHLAQEEKKTANNHAQDRRAHYRSVAEWNVYVAETALSEWNAAKAACLTVAEFQRSKQTAKKERLLEAERQRRQQAIQQRNNSQQQQKPRQGATARGAVVEGKGDFKRAQHSRPPPSSQSARVASASSAGVAAQSKQARVLSAKAAAFEPRTMASSNPFEMLTEQD